MIKERTLQAWINQQLVGELSENNGLWQFQYAETWLTEPTAFALAPNLQLQQEAHIDGASERPVQWFFDNLLPEETARELLAKDLSMDKGDIFGMLAAVGAESAGALSLIASGELLAPGSLIPLSKQEISARIKHLPKTPLNNRRHKRMSMAGAQHKMLLVVDPNSKDYFEPAGQAVSTHILKPEHTQPDIYPFSVRNEYFIMSLAHRCGLMVPPVLIDYVPQGIFIIQRFDRIWDQDQQQWQRLHVLDGCQMMGLAPYQKYNLSTLESVANLARQCRNKAQTIIRIYRWVLFNYLVGNGDAHLKNLSFVPSQNGLELAPHYDLVSTAVYADAGKHVDEPLSQPIGSATSFGAVTREACIEAASHMGLKQTVAAKEIDKLVQIIRIQAHELLALIETSAPYPGKEGELRLLRQIAHMIIGEFAARIE